MSGVSVNNHNMSGVSVNNHNMSGVSVNNHFSIFCLFKEMMYGDFANDVYILVICCKLHAVCGPEVLRNICS